MRTKIVTILAFVLFINVNAQDKKWTLQECVSYALDNNISIKQQELNNELIAEDITIAKGNFLPNLNASSSQNYNFGAYVDAFNNYVSLGSRSNNFSINSGVTLYNGLKNKNNLLLAKKNLEAAGFDLEENKNNIMLYVVNAYLNILLNKENVIIAKEQISVSERQVQQAKGLVEAGSNPVSYLLDVEATLAANDVQLTTAQNALDISRLNLAQLLLLPYEGFDVVDVELSLNSASLLYNNTEEIFQKSSNFLPEIKSAEIAVDNSDLSVKIALADYYPTVNFGGGIGTSYQHTIGEKDVVTRIDPVTNEVLLVANGFGKQLSDNLGYNFGISLNIPIFNRFQIKSNVNRARINKKKAVLNLEDEKIKLREKIENAYVDARASLNQFISAEKSLKAQEESFKNAQESYNSGVMTSFDFDQVRNRLVSAQSSMVNAKYNFVFKTKVLEYYYGIPIIID
ncbi:MAG: transporter [Lutibacter sp.]|nr:MAG: transporter [Lutibacter sp.]